MEINIVRCLLIFLVILIHCTPFKDSYPNAQNAILAFVVPLFLFITGYLFNVKKTWKEFAHYLYGMLMMYAIFEIAYIILSYYFPVRDGVTELTVAVILDRMTLHPIGPYWYLHTMIICSCIYYLSHRLSYRFNKDIAISSAIFLGVIISFYTPLLGLLSPLAYFMGVIAKQRVKHLRCVFCDSFMGLPIAIATLLYGICNNHAYAAQLSYFSILLSICTITFLLWCSRRIPIIARRIIGYIGGNTLPIYLFHPLFTLLSKRMLHGLIEHGYIISYSLIVIIIATIGSLAIGYVMDKTRTSRLLFRKKMLRSFNYSHKNINGIDL